MNLGKMSYNLDSLLNLAKQFNSFYIHGLRDKNWSPLFIESHHVGFVRPHVAKELLRFDDVFTLKPKQNGVQVIEMNPSYKSYNERTKIFDEIWRKLKGENTFPTLNGWRGECYEIKGENGTPLLEIERAACSLVGMQCSGIHINGYVNHPTKGLCLWLQQRSFQKQMWPGKWDSMVGGAITVGLSIRETAVKEAMEEASITKEISNNLISSGSVSFLLEADDQIHAATEYVFDLKLPVDFEPKVNDNEVQSFQLCTIDECFEKLLSSTYKLTSVPVILDFFIRHGIISSDTSPSFIELVELLHVPFHNVFNRSQF